MIISFAHTTAALLAGRKTVTRRDWSDDYAVRLDRIVPFIADAWDKSPRVIDRKTGKPIGRKVAEIKVTSIAKQPMNLMPDSDYEGEGFAYMYEHPECLPKKLWGAAVSGEDFAPHRFDHWRHSGTSMWVVRFEVVRVVSAYAECMDAEA